MHLQFSHYEKYDKFLDDVIPAEEWVRHQRRSAVWLHDRFVPYPFQLHLHHLPPESRWQCLSGLLDLQGQPRQSLGNFREWIEQTFGTGIGHEFLLPYNEKIWATPCEQMNVTWVGERVAVPDTRDVIRRLCLEEDKHDWGPNACYRYPLRGGTGRIWSEAARRLPWPVLQTGQQVIAIDPYSRTVTTERGGLFEYDALISTLPVTVLMSLLPENLRLAEVKDLRATHTLVVGVGVQGAVPEPLRDLIWGYYPDPKISFYRMTVLSNLSPYMVPDPDTMWSVLMEVAMPPENVQPDRDLVSKVEHDLQRLGFLSEEATVVSRWHRHLNYGYPVPTVDRDEVLQTVIPFLESLDIYSRGRFGGWKYEVSNQDHSFMQGVEVVERLVNGRPEPTYFQPDLVNCKYNEFPYSQWEADARLQRA